MLPELEEELCENRLRWACRRGMLELDIFLGGFLNSTYVDLTLEDKLIFQRLLKESDQTLLAYFMGQEAPTEPETVSVIEKIRLTAAA